MRNVFLFIRKYSNFLFFLLLQIIALSFLFRYNKYHEAAFMNVAGEITGSLNQRYSKVEYYFHLKKINEQLAAENLRLNQLIRENYERADGNEKTVWIPYRPIHFVKSENIPGWEQKWSAVP